SSKENLAQNPMNCTIRSISFAVAMLLSVAAPWTAQRASAQNRWNIDTTCLQLYFHALYNGNDYYHDDSLYNPDSVMLDTCLPVVDDAPIWIHRAIHLIVPIRLPWGPPDTILEAPWTKIDTSYPLFRTVFQKIYDSIGPYVMRKDEPDDTSDADGFGFEFNFFSFSPADSVYHYLLEIPNLVFTFAKPLIPGGAGVSEGLDATVKQFMICPNITHGIATARVPSLGNDSKFVA